MNKAKNKRQKWCKQCFSSYEKEVWKNDPSVRKKRSIQNKSRMERNREYIKKHLSDKSCTMCGISDPRVLEFDHIDPIDKIANISDLRARACSIKKLQEEIDKCQILCANCHRIRTYQQFNWN